MIPRIAQPLWISDAGLLVGLIRHIRPVDAGYEVSVKDVFTRIKAKFFITSGNWNGERWEITKEQYNITIKEYE